MIIPWAEASRQGRGTLPYGTGFTEPGTRQVYRGRETLPYNAHVSSS